MQGKVALPFALTPVPSLWKAWRVLPQAVLSLLLVFLILPPWRECACSRPLPRSPLASQDTSASNQSARSTRRMRCGVSERSKGLQTVIRRSSAASS